MEVFYYQTTDKEVTEPITSFNPFFLLGFVCLVFFFQGANAYKRP